MIKQGIDAPILISGPDRSGAGRIQQLLARHPRIFIHGGAPGLSKDVLRCLRQVLLSCTVPAGEIQPQLGQELPEHSPRGVRRCREVFRRALKDRFSDFTAEKPRWGLLWPGLCADPKTVRQLETLWPLTRWIVCLADPLSTIERAKGAFLPGLDILRSAEEWVRTCKFVQRHDRSRVALVQFDKLDGAPFGARRAAIDRVMACIGEKPTNQTEEVFSCWPRLPSRPRRMAFTLCDEAGQMLFEEVPELERWMKRMGYQVPRRTASATA